MPKINYKALQNGSDIRGVALPTVSDEPVNLTDAVIENIITGFIYLLANKLSAPLGDLRVSVGRDSRTSGEHIARIVCKTLQKLGVQALDTGLASTPAMFMSTKIDNFNCHGAIMITASHLPQNRNGFKFFSASGGVGKDTINKILEIAEQRDENSSATASLYENEMRHEQGAYSIKPIEKIDIMSKYCEILRKQISVALGSDEKPLSGMKILVDAGNGVGGFYAENILKPLGADTAGSLYLEPDGTFPNHIPNPEKNEAVQDIIQQVKARGADLALVFDTDVDRVAAIDEKGKPMVRNGIIAVAASLIYKLHPASFVVTDSITSPELAEFLNDKLGLRHFRYRRGYKNVIDKAKTLIDEGKDCQLAIETSGHAAFKENFFLDDGAFLATKIVIEATRLKKEGMGISSLTSELSEPAESMEYRLPINAKGEKVKKIGEAVLSTLEEWTKDEGSNYGAVLEEPNYEGVRIKFPNGWLLLRMSLHDPIMPLNIESQVLGGTKRIISLIKPLLDTFAELDTDTLDTVTLDADTLG